MLLHSFWDDMKYKLHFPTPSLCLKDADSELKARSRRAQSLAQAKETLITLKQKQEFTSGAQHLNSPPSPPLECAHSYLYNLFLTED